MNETSLCRAQVKICGLTNVKEALGCVRLGANAIGCVFYPKSPRNVTEEQARNISTSLPSEVKAIGVFVNESFSNIMRKVERCQLQGVQIHGQEPPELITQLRGEKLVVIKGLFMESAPFVNDAPNYDASAFLVECGKGVLPGGNAVEWRWGAAKDFGERYPLILAGGLTPGNVSQAILSSQPDAVDVSSGVESSPGRKDLAKVEAFIHVVSQSKLEKSIRPIFLKRKL